MSFDSGADEPDAPDAGGPGIAAAPAPPGDPGVAAERDRLTRTLRDTRLQLAMTQARLAALEQSASMQLGRALTRAARRPWPRGVQLPVDLIRLWRERGLARPGPASLALASAQLSDLAGGGERFLSSLTAPGLGAPGAASARFTPPGLVITGALSARACATLAPDAAVLPLLPHDADVMLESAGADIVLIEAAAMLPGSAWAYAGDPAAADRGRRLGRLIAAAHALGKPVIFVRNVPAYLAPGLDWVAAGCDAVSGDGLGVQLATFNPVGLAGDRPSEPVFAGGRHPRESPGVRALLDSVAGSVRFTGEVAWRQLPALYRGHAVFVAVSAAQAREQLACGARVIMITGPQAIPEGPDTPGGGTGGEPGWSASGLREAIASARANGPQAGAEILPVIREIFARHATPVRLAGLARLAGLPDRLVAGRQIAVLARVTDAAGAAALAARLRRQQMAPAELVTVVGTRHGEDPEVSCRAVTAALGGLAGLGVTVKTSPDMPAARDAAGIPGRPWWVPQAARLADSPWVMPWQADREDDECYLLDLACARECSQADGVGEGGTAYASVTSLEPDLARREFFGSDGTGHGLRFFSLR